MLEVISDIKKSFFALRNGILADTLRKAGMSYKVIFGLQIPQIAEIARGLEPSEELATELWKDREVRESRLLACYLFRTDETDMAKALELATDVRTPEEADMLAFRLFKRLPFAGELLDEMERRQDVPRCAAVSLRRHLE